jgi:hypothetical protein
MATVWKALLCAHQAAAGNLHEVGIPKATAALERAIARDRSMLVVAPGTSGRLNGFALFGPVEPWSSSVPHMSELCLCIDSGHLRSASVRGSAVRNRPVCPLMEGEPVINVAVR